MAIEKDRTIIVNCDFTIEFSGKIANQILDIAMSATDKPIYIIINSNGGDIRALRTVIAALQVSTCKIVTIITGVARSCGSILFLQGEDRIMLKDSELLFHEPAESFTNAKISYTTFLKIVEELKIDYNFFLNEILRKTTIPRQTLLRRTKNKDFILNPEEALKVGAATRIITKITEL